MISFKAPKLDKFKSGMKDRHKKASNQRKVNAAALVMVDRWIQKNFQREGDPKWKPLSPVTIALRRRGRGAGRPKILQDTGQLKTRWKHLFTHKKSVIQSGVEYGLKHEEGLRVPKRKILPTNKQIWPELKKVYQSFVKRSLK